MGQENQQKKTHRKFQARFPCFYADEMSRNNEGDFMRENSISRVDEKL